MAYGNGEQRSHAAKDAPKEVPLGYAPKEVVLGAPFHVSIFLSHSTGGGLILVALIIAR
jgi:hypothetical protein